MLNSTEKIEKKEIIVTLAINRVNILLIVFLDYVLKIKAIPNKD